MRRYFLLTFSSIILSGLLLETAHGKSLFKDICRRAASHFIFYDQGPNNFKNRLATAKQIREDAKNGNVDGIIQILKDSHNGPKDFKMGQLMLGRDAARERKLEQRRTITSAEYVTSYFITKKNQGVDTFSTVYFITNGKKILTEVEKEAISDGNKWLKKAKEYWDEMETDVHQAVDAFLTAEHIKKKYAHLKRSDFDNGELEIETISSKGETEIIHKSSLEKLEKYVKKMEKKTKFMFSQYFWDDYFRHGGLYERMDLQVEMIRRLGFIYDILAETPSSSLHTSQIQLRRDIKTFFENNPPFRGRSDAAKALQKKELKEEWDAMWHIKIAERIREDMKFKVPEKVLKRIESVTFFGHLKKFFGVAGLATVLGGGTLAYLTLPLEEWPPYKYMVSFINNEKNDLILEYVNITGPLRDCVESDRNWTRDEVTMINFINSHTDHHRFKSRFDPASGDYNLNKKLEQYKEELRIKCIVGRHHYKMAQDHVLNKMKIKIAVRKSVDVLFLELLDETHEQAETLHPLIKNLFTLYLQGQSEEEFQKIFKKIRIIDEHLFEGLIIYFEKVEVAAKTLNEGSLPHYSTLEEFINNMDKHYQADGTLQ